MKIRAHLLIVFTALILSMRGPALGQTPAISMEFDSIRAVAGESRFIASKNEIDSIASLTSTRITPSLTYPIQLEVVTETGKRHLRVAIPPATPPGEYTVDLTGLSSDGTAMSTTFHVTVDPVTVPAMAAANQVPVILLNGWQAAIFGCPTSDSTVIASQAYFGQLASLLQSDGVPVLFFNNCTYGDLPIEGLAAQLGVYINRLHYTDGTPVPQVDLVGHSMGGLIARAYLSGKSQISGSFAPPVNHKVRKLITIATPHFGSFQATNYSFFGGVQLPELELGSQFLWDLATWNQGGDDFRGVDALAIVGNGGNYYSPVNADDGIVSLTSASLNFAGYEDQRTRIIPYCHRTPGIGVYCPSTQAPIADINNASHPTAQLVRSFLADTAAWRSLGTTPSQNPFLSQSGGIALVLKGSNDAYFRDLISVLVDSGANQLSGGTDSSIASIYYDEFVPAGQHTFAMNHNGGSRTNGMATVRAGGSWPILFKYGPRISSVQSLFPTGLPGLTVASGSTIIVNGAGFTSSATLSVNGNPLTISQITDQQITAYLPAGYSGLVRLKTSNANGQHTVGIMTAPPASPPSIVISPSQLKFSCTISGPLPAAQTISVNNAGGNSLSWTAASNTTWLIVSPASGTAPSTLTVSINPSSLSPRVYNGSITLTAPGATNSPQVLSVSMTVTALSSLAFPQVAIGGDMAGNGTYTTTFTLMNTGSEPLNGNLILTRHDGSPLRANLSSAQANFNGSSIPVSIMPGQTVFLTARTVNPSDTAVYTGWGRVESSGGTLAGVATFQVTANGVLQSIAGVQASYPISAGTIPVDDDVSSGRYTGYAVANMGSSSIIVSVSEVSADGRTENRLSDIPLSPGQQKAAFFFQDARASQRFRGSAYLRGGNGATFATVALVVNQNLLTAIPVVQAQAPNPPNTTFGHLAIGGGYSTVFTLMNTGTDTMNGNLILTGQDGRPLSASMTDGQTSVTGSNFPVTIQSGGTKFVTIASVNQADPTTAGWARVSNSSGTFGGVATFQLTGSSGTLQTIAGVLSSAPISVATIPVDDDTSANRFTGYAIANPGTSPITIKLEEVSADGSRIAVLSPLSIDPGRQVAHFLFQDPKAGQKFQGSLVLVGQNGAQFSIVGLVQNQGLITAIPVVPGKAPNIN